MSATSSPRAENRSIPSGAKGPESAGVDLTSLVEKYIDQCGGKEKWSIKDDGFWYYVTPPGHLRRDQGWKIHVSGTPLSAPAILAAAAEILVEARCAFKFARGFKEIEELVSSRCDRGSGGKFITVYPDDDDQFRAVIGMLDLATRGHAGPGILSDRAYAPGSLVHYRYGGFSPRQVLNTEGSYEFVLVEPNGAFLRDKRTAWYSSPAWAPPPLPGTPAAKSDSERGKKVLLADRYLVDEAIRHSFRGGVYRALDQKTGERVVIKQARPYVGADLTGKDARDWMRHEADMLALFEPMGLTPRLVGLFDYQGDLFLVEEELKGKSLRHWCEEKLKTERSRSISVPDATAMAVALVKLVEFIHDKGFVMRDFNPGNIVVTDDSPRLIDLEFLARPGEHVRNISTFGYTAPEQLVAGRYGPAPEKTADLYSLGATLLYLSANVDPVLAEDDQPARSYSERIAAFVRAAAADGEVTSRFAPAILGLVADDPAQRWSLTQTREFLANLSENASSTPFSAREQDARLSESDQRKLLRDGLAYTVATMTPDEDHLWPPIVAEGMTSDPCNVQCGAGGILAVLNRAALDMDDPSMREGLATASAWLKRRLPQEPRVLPGLYFGRSGTTWALHEAATTLGDSELAGWAADYARLIPLRWPNTDLTHGTAGAGMAMLYFFAATGDPDFADRAHHCARGLVTSAERRTSGIRWSVSDDFPSRMAGISHYGYAHGVAGMSMFLLAAGRMFGDEEYLELARAGGETLVHAAIRQGEAARWATGEEGAEDIGLTWWCSGSAGVGTFLVRLWQATGDDRFRELAEAAAVAVRTEKWLYSPTACHGASSGGEFLLDLADALGDDRYRRWAEELAMCVFARNTIRNGRLVVPADSMSTIEMGYNSGLAGTLGFLLRLRYGGDRMWTADGLTPPAHAAKGSS